MKKSFLEKAEDIAFWIMIILAIVILIVSFFKGD